MAVRTPKEVRQSDPAPMYPAMAGPRNGPTRKVVPLCSVSATLVRLDWQVSYQILIIRGHSVVGSA